MTTALKQLILFYAFVAICATISATSVLYFPYISAEQQRFYFSLVVSVLLFVIPMVLMISVFRLGSK